MESILPPYKDFIELEWETLKLLHDYLSQWAALSHSAGFVAQCWNYKNLPRFQFSTYWNIDYRDKECRVFLGADVRKQDGSERVADMTYFICIVEGTDKPTKVLRKFHFDYVTARADRRKPHPRFHLQYCGGLPPPMESLGITKELMIPLLPDVKEPRIFFMPVTLGLVMNIAFYEFPTKETDEIKKRGEWQNLIRKNEKVILKPFYKKCADLAGRDNVVFFEQVYVK